jgi:hypothetical protein
MVSGGETVSRNDGVVVVYQSSASSHGRLKWQKMNILPLLECGEIN